MSRRVTMQQIADYLGVSKFVVSKTLSGKKGVSFETRERVLKAATQLGYFVNKGPQIASESVLTGRKQSDKNTIMVLMPNVRLQTKESLYWGKILEGISSDLDSRGIGMVIITDNSVDNLMRIMKPEGFLGLIGVGHISSPLFMEMHRSGLPLVLVDHEDPLIPADTLFVNNSECMFRITNYLIGQGHHSIQFVGDIHYSPSFYDRWLGFRKSLEENHIRYPMETSSYLINMNNNPGFTVEKAFQTWLTEAQHRKTLPTAFACANDETALEVCSLLKRNEIQIPEQISVTGFDNIYDAIEAVPSLTTVNVNKEFLGKRAVERLMWRIDHQDYPNEKILISGNMIIRASTEVSQKNAIIK